MAKLTDVLPPPDTRANQPAATAVSPGTLYSVSDEGNKVEQSDGAAWVDWAGGVPAGVILDDGSVPMAAALDMGSNPIDNLDDPASAQQAATKAYVDAGDVPTVDSQIVVTDESQASGSGGSGWLDLATVGPVVTITTGAVAVIEMRAKIRRPGGGGGFTGFIALAVSGATTINPSAPNPVFPSNGGDDGIAGSGSAEQVISGTYVITGLTPGVNVFTMKYHNDGGGTWNFRQRFMKVFAP